jgi:hypothetical protein
MVLPVSLVAVKVGDPAVTNPSTRPLAGVEPAIVNVSPSREPVTNRTP